MIYLLTLMIHCKLDAFHVNRTINYLFCITSAAEGDFGPVKLIEAPPR